MIPRFAVVGCVNMGKSSLVATLTEHDWIPIDRRPGTTIQADSYDLRLGDETVLSLIDTPGFQNARRALAWVEAWLEEQAAADPTPPDALRAFVAAHRAAPQFVNEVRLLQPILDGAGIIYVVNGSKDYQHRYAAEMRLLAFTGAARMAVINLVDGGEPQPQWRDALQPFFKVTTFDALRAASAERLRLLASFAGVDEAWAPIVDRAVGQLQRELERRQGDVAACLADCLVDALTMVAEAPLDGSGERQRQTLASELADRLRQRERQARQEVEAVYRHSALQRVESELPVLDADLLDRRAWRLLGLSRRQILTGGAAAGATVGGVIDAGTGGASFFAGTAIGAVLGGVGSFFGARQAADAQLFGQRLGGDRLQVLPPEGVQFPFVLLDRALLHWRAVRGRAHARRDALELPPASDDGLVRELPAELRKELSRCFARLRKAAGQRADEADRQSLKKAVGRAMAAVSGKDA